MDKLGYSIKDICDLSGAGKDLIYNEINNGNLKSAKVGRRRIIRREAAEQWLKDHEKKTSEAMGFEDSAE